MKKTGRPFSPECDAAEKSCLHCGNSFRLRDKAFQSLARFHRRKYCSIKCSDAARRKVSDKEDVFWGLLVKRPNGCWEWPGKKHDNGYGRMTQCGKSVRTHRFAYQLAHGPIPDGMMILHSCDNRPCCNPEHLRVGTAKENLQDAISRGRFRGNLIKNKDDPRIFEGTLKQAARTLGVSETTIWNHRRASAA